MSSQAQSPQSATLEEKLAQVRAGAKERIPAEALEVMSRVTRELVDTGLAGKAHGEGDRMPSFELPDTGGNPVASARLLDQGPLVVTFYRGVW